MLSLSFSRRLAVMFALALVCVSSVVQAQPYVTHGVVSQVQKRHVSPKHAALQGALLLRKGIEEPVISNLRAPPEIWTIVIQYADGSSEELTEIGRPYIQVGHTVCAGDGKMLFLDEKNINNEICRERMLEAARRQSTED